MASGTANAADEQKRAAAAAALAEVEPGMRLGLGTGSTARHLVALLGEKVKAGFDVLCVPTSEVTAAQARGLGIRLGDLETLDRHVRAVLDDYRPDLVLYQAGVDPYQDDRWGHLALTLDGLRRRDERVLRACAAAAVPVVTLFGGGYARRFEDTVEAHCNTVRVAARL